MGFLKEIGEDRKAKIKKKIEARAKAKALRKPTKRVYIMKFTLKEETVYKIGVTGRLVKKRMFEVIDSFHTAYGYVPMCEVIRGMDKKHRIEGFENAEMELLKMFGHLRINWMKPFNGSSEFRRVKEEDVLKEYDIAIKKWAKV